MDLSCSSISCPCELHGVVSDYATLVGSLSDKGDITGTVSGALALHGSVQLYNASAPPDYTGVYEVTPSQQTQTLSTANTLLAKDITINPIPENYGLITWDGATLTVS